MTLTPLSLPPGINSVDTPFSAAGRWAAGDNVRFSQGGAQPIGGWANGTSTIVTTCKDLFFSFRSAGDKLFYGGISGLYLGAGLSAPSLNSAIGASIGWSFAAWGDDALCCSIGGKLYLQSGTSAAAEVTEAPDRINAGILVSDQRQVLAFATNEVGGADNPNCIRVSDIEDFSSAGSWTPTSTNNADEIILPSSGIVCARQVGPYIAVWTESALYLGQFIGDPSQSYRFDKVADISRPVSPRAVVVVNGVAYWWGADSVFYQWQPGAIPAQIPCPLDFSMAEAVDPTSTSFAWYNRKFNEVWFHYGHTDDDPDNYATRYVVFCIAESTAAQRPVWFQGSMTRSAMISGRPSEVAVGASGLANAALFTHPDSVAENANRSWYIQSADQYIDQSQRRLMIRGVIPDLKNQSGDVSLTLFVRDRPQSAAVTKGPHTLTTSATKKDFRASGKMVAAKFSGAAGTYARLGKPLFDTVPLGER